MTDKRTKSELAAALAEAEGIIEKMGNTIGVGVDRTPMAATAEPTTGAGGIRSHAAKWKERAILWGGFFLAGCAAAWWLAGDPDGVFGSVGHLIGASLLATAVLLYFMLIIFWGFDFMTQAREVNRAIDRVDDWHRDNPGQRTTEAQGLVYLAGGIQTAGAFIFAGLVLYSVLSHLAEMLVTKIT